MSVFSYARAKPVRFTRTVVIATLLGATMLAAPFNGARAEGDAVLPMQLAQAAATTSPANAASTAETKAETVEQRIVNLHAALQITPAEEANWNAVALAMRENAVEMQKLVAEKTAKEMASMTAVEDLQTYGKFARAHVKGLKQLTSAFETLYKAMPDSQKKIADQVFQDSGRDTPAAHG
jgi:protein CpxP